MYVGMEFDMSEEEYDYKIVKWLAKEKVSLTLQHNKIFKVFTVVSLSAKLRNSDIADFWCLLEGCDSSTSPEHTL